MSEVNYRMASKNENVTVYVVDDDVAIRDSLTILLNAYGIQTRTYATPDELLAEPGDSRNGCLVLDARLPGMSGLELLDRLAREGNQLPVFMITGHGDKNTLSAAEKKGVVKCFRKPFDSDLLVSCIRRALFGDD